MESFEAEQMPPPMCHSSMNKNKKRKCNEEQEPLERVSTPTATSNSNGIEQRHQVLFLTHKIVYSFHNAMLLQEQGKGNKENFKLLIYLVG